MQEIVFYFHRLTVRGICLTIMEEFSKVLNGEQYSILPLIRPTASNQEAARRLEQSGDAVLCSHNNLVFNLMKRPADRAKRTEEVISRDGLDASTLDDNGQPLLCRPTKQAKIALDIAVGGGGKSQQSIDTVALKKMKKPELVALAARENVVMAKANPTKDHYIAAILASRYPTAAMENGDSGTGAGGSTLTASSEDVRTEEAMENGDSGIGAGGSTLTASSEDVTSVEFRLLMSKSCKDLVAIAEKEKVKILKPKSRRNKTDYATAICNARLQRNTSM
jgi:hypothetical protein